MAYNTLFEVKRMKANQKFKSLRQDEGGYQKIVAGLVALLLTILIGVMVYWEVSESFTFSSADANTSADGVDDMATTIFDLLPLIALVVVAGIILAIVLGFGGQDKGKGGI